MERGFASRGPLSRQVDRPGGRIRAQTRLGLGLAASLSVAVPLSATAGAAPEPPFWVRVARAAERPGAATSASDEPGQPTAWLRLGLERTQQGRYEAAAQAYVYAIASGATEPAVYTNLGEVLMADGRLAEAEARYREAIAVASAAASGDPRARTQDLALAHYGLAVALDRDEQPVAAREMMGRALVLDPQTAVLKVATLANADLFFIPDGEVFYYLGLAAVVAGRRGDAVDAYREFLTRAPPGNRWARSAQRHIIELTTAHATAPDPRPPRGPRLVTTGTVLATGGLAAPLLDAAWRDQAAILDGCLDAGGDLGIARAGLRFAIELDIDARGRVVGVTAKVPSPPGEPFARCVETAVKSGLHLRAPAPARATHARTEFIIGWPGFPSGEGAGYR
jgi:tetratricopeptide (TPR) repeat protein